MDKDYLEIYVQIRRTAHTFSVYENSGKIRFHAIDLLPYERKICFHWSVKQIEIICDVKERLLLLNVFLSYLLFKIRLL